jgi:hypothetical protein
MRHFIAAAGRPRSLANWFTKLDTGLPGSGTLKDDVPPEPHRGFRRNLNPFLGSTMPMSRARAGADGSAPLDTMPRSAEAAIGPSEPGGRSRTLFFAKPNWASSFADSASAVISGATLKENRLVVASPLGGLTITCRGGILALAFEM